MLSNKLIIKLTLYLLIVPVVQNCLKLAIIVKTHFINGDLQDREIISMYAIQLLLIVSNFTDARLVVMIKRLSLHSMVLMPTSPI